MNPLVLAYAPVLRDIRDKRVGHDVLKLLAQDHGKIPSNLRRDLVKLEELGVVRDQDAVIGMTGLGLRLLAGLDVADGKVAAPEGHVLALAREIGRRPDLNPRKTFDADELDALRESIVEKGLLQKPMLRPVDDSERGQADAANGVRFWVVMGERRVRAVGLAVEDGDWPDDLPLLCECRTMGDEEHLDLALAENLHRADLDHIELGEAFEAKARLGHNNAAIAGAFKRTPEFVQQHRRLLQLSEAERERMRLPKDDPDRLTLHAALRLIANHKDPRPGGEREGPAPPAGEGEADGALPVNFTSEQALVLAELALKAHRDPISFARGGYTAIDWELATACPKARLLVSKGVMGFRMAGDLYEARVSPDGDAETMLRACALAPDQPAARENVAELRRDVFGLDRAVDAQLTGRYLTPWLNTPLAAAPAPSGDARGGEQPAEAGRSPPADPLRSALGRGEAHDYGADHPDQSPLLPPTDEEAERIREAADDQRRREQLAGGLDHVAGQVRARLPALAYGLDRPAWDTADSIVWHMAEADLAAVMAGMVVLGCRVGWMNAAGEVRAAQSRAGIDARAVRARLAKDSPDYAAAHGDVDVTELETAEEAEDAE